MAHDTDTIEVVYRAASSLSDPRMRYQGFDPHEEVIPSGTVMRPGARPLTCDILFQRDVEVRLRDGTKIYTDIFRPVGDQTVPAIVAWSPYGKNLGYFHLDDLPFRMGVPPEWVSELNKWEAPDPAVWCARGYAVVNPDARGAYTSDGDLQCWNAQEGRDGADFIDWVGEQAWCTGKVGMAGNSWLAASQWFIAAERPRHLAAIAPWEGLSDVYRNLHCWGGIPDPRFMDFLRSSIGGKNRVADLTEMLRRYPAFNAYWEEHAARVEQIEVPAYVVGSWSSPLHCQGTFDAYDRLQSPKWLRVHHTQEWPDFYDAQNDADLARFFDHFLKGKDNGWEATPPVRLSVFTVGPDRATVINRAEDAFPLARTRYKELYLEAAGRSLSSTKPSTSGAVEYSAANSEHVVFHYKFDEVVEWTGFAELVLFVEARGAEDLDIFVRFTKLDTNGKLFRAVNLPTEVAFVRDNMPGIEQIANTPFKYNYFFEGPWGRIRASHRALDEGRSQDGRPVLSHRNPSPPGDGKIVEVRIPISPSGIEFHPGETLQVIIETENPMPQPLGDLPTEVIRAGTNLVHTGGAHASYLRIPQVNL
jgi:uncharacterized protein